ncbi:MAG: T9SS type A sorting domain-containing protein [Ignavibacteriaceae bacterium]|nr:T9SS type A sorting domain-containing protein [Ignavibacteriaceae bacterium]
MKFYNQLHFKNLFRIILFTLVNLTAESSASQPPDTMWTKTFGGSNIDIGHCVELTTDGGFVITGYTRSYGTMSGRNVLLIKTDINGNTLWINAYGGNDDDEGYSVKQTPDGGYIIAGYTKSFGSGLKDVYLIKTDSSGNLQWSKTFGGAQDDEGYSLQLTASGGCVIGGVTSSSGAGSRDVWLIKTDISGNLIWQKTHGGLSSDGAWYVQNTSDGGYVLTGWTFSYGPGYVGNTWLVKTDSLGNQQWNKFFGGSDVDRGYCVQQTSDGGYIITGYTASFGAGLDDMLLIKTDSLGNSEWQKTFGGTGRDYGQSVQQTSDNGYIVVGYTLSFGAGGDDIWLVKTDTNGNEEWDKTLGGSASDVGYCVKEIPDGGCILTGHTLSFGAGVHDVWLIKMDNIIPVEIISFTANLENENVILHWTTSTETNNSGFKILRFSQDDNEWKEIGFVPGSGTSTEFRYYSFTDKNIPFGKNLYRLKQIDFDGQINFSGVIEVDAEFIPKELFLYQNYPNPFNPVTTINYDLPDAGEVTLIIYDILGKKAKELVNGKHQAGRYAVQLNASDFDSGVYIYQLVNGNHIISKKMILLK